MKATFLPSLARSGSRCTVVLRGSAEPKEHHLNSFARAATLAAESLRWNPEVNRAEVWSNTPVFERVILVES